MEALVLPKVTTNPPSHPVLFSHICKHLLSIHLADVNFGTPGSVDLLLGADVFNCMMLHGWWFGPLESTSAFETCFGGVVAGATHTEHILQQFTSVLSQHSPIVIFNNLGKSLIGPMGSFLVLTDVLLWMTLVVLGSYQISLTQLLVLLL